MRMFNVMKCDFRIIIVLFLSSISLLAQSMTPRSECQNVIQSSVRSVFIEGAISDRNVVKTYNVTFDFNGKGLPHQDINKLLTEYTIPSVGEDGRLYKGNIQVFSSYAWSGGDFHNWCAYFPSAVILKLIKLYKNKKIIKQEKIHIIYGNDNRIDTFKVGENIEWRSSLNTFEILISTDNGKSWNSIPELRAPNGSIPLDKVIKNVNGDILFLITASDKNSIINQLWKSHFD